MMSSKEIPSREKLIDFPGAVAGHAGTLCDTDGHFFIKPCTQAEIDFYETARAHHPEITDLMPLYIGSLMLTEAPAAVADLSSQLPVLLDTTNLEAAGALAAGLIAPVAAPVAASADNETWIPHGSQSIESDRSVVLENATYGYQSPNVLDVKLGQRLWADNAPRQKRVRMDEVRATTTHDKLGFRISGMRVFRGSDKAHELDESHYKTYDKDFGRYTVNTDNVVDAFRKFIFNEAAGIDADLGRAVAAAFKDDLVRVRDVLEKERTRMYSSSVLLVFEGDGAALRAAIAATDDAAASLSRSRSRRENRGGEGKSVDRSSSRTDSGIVIEDDDTEIEVEISMFSEEIYDEDDEDDEPELPPICGLRLIDFAHARFCPEEEQPDENVLVGVRNLIRIFDELSQ